MSDKDVKRRLAVRMISTSRSCRPKSRKVYEVNPLVCPQCSATMKVIAFLTNYAVVDRIIDHLKLTFLAERPPPPHLAYQESLVAAETSGEYLS